MVGAQTLGTGPVSRLRAPGGACSCRSSAGQSRLFNILKLQPASAPSCRFAIGSQLLSTCEACRLPITIKAVSEIRVRRMQTCKRAWGSGGEAAVAGSGGRPAHCNLALLACPRTRLSTRGPDLTTVPQAM